MKDGFTDKDIEQLQAAALRAKSDRYYREIREERKRWLPFDEPITFESLLGRLTKDDLTAIRTNLGLKGVSSLKKQQLVAVLEQSLPAELPQVLNMFDDTRYKILKRMSDRGGRTYFSIGNLELDYFKERGLIFPGSLDDEKVLVTPQEVLDVFREMDGPAYRERVRKNTELIQLTQGMVFSYGMLRYYEFKVMLSRYMEIPDEYRTKMMYLLADAAEYYRTFWLRSSEIIDSRILDPQELKAEQEARPDLPYYPFTKAQLLRAADPDYVERTPSFQAFVNYLRKYYRVDREEAELMVEICVEEAQTGATLQEQIEDLQGHFDTPNLQALNSLVAHLVELINNSRQWIIKGHTPMELRPREKLSPLPVSQPASKGVVLDFATRKKVGRNDPCPCGSGKKYKKCCGNA